MIRSIFNFFKGEIIGFKNAYSLQKMRDIYTIKDEDWKSNYHKMTTRDLIRDYALGVEALPKGKINLVGVLDEEDAKYILDKHNVIYTKITEELAPAHRFNTIYLDRRADWIRKIENDKRRENVVENI